MQYDPISTTLPQPDVISAFSNKKMLQKKHFPIAFFLSEEFVLDEPQKDLKKQSIIFPNFPTFQTLLKSSK